MSDTLNRKVIRRGQRVYCGLYGGRNGIVYAIHGEQQPLSVQSICGVAVTGGSAELDIAFDDHLSQRVPEAIVRGVQWEIYDDGWSLAGEDEIQALIAQAVATEAAKKLEASNKAQARQDEAARLRAAPEYKHLSQTGPSPSHDGVLVAKNIRAELKLAYPGVKFSVRKEYYGSVHVQWTGGPDRQAVENIIGKYEDTGFDGQTDSSYSKASAWNDVFGGCRFVSARRDRTPEEQAQYEADDLTRCVHYRGLANVPKHTTCPACSVHQGGS